MPPASETQTARPTRLPRSARRKQLLEAAQEVFVAQGYHAAAMDDIAERAGVSKPVLYQHFPGKLDLYLALLDTHCDAILERMRAAMSSSTDNKVRVAAATTAYFDFIDHESEAFRDIEIRSDQTFKDLHTAIKDAFAFVGQEMACFYVSDDEWGKGPEIPLADLGFAEDGGTPPSLMHDVFISDHIRSTRQRFIYAYDFLHLWMFMLELIAAQPDLTLQELKDELGTDLSRSTLCAALAKLRLTLKKKS